MHSVPVPSRVVPTALDLLPALEGEPQHCGRRTL